MQTIKHEYQNMHPVFDALERFYAYASDINHSKELIRPVFDSSFTGLCNAFSTYVDMPMPTLKNLAYEPLQLPEYDNNNVIVCFSGGKDSIAVVLKLLEMGCNVYLYHAMHVNPSIGDEWKRAMECAEVLELPIFIDDIRLSGYHDYMEHPMKNMIIANGALHYGIREGIGTRVVFGNYTTSDLDDNVFDRCAGDCMEMWEFYDSIIQRAVPGFTVENYLTNMGMTLEYVAHDSRLMATSVSCLCRHSLRQYRHDWVLNKFGVDLPKHRCGSCYKCCIEYVYMADHDLIEFVPDYYRYCLNQLYKVGVAEYIILCHIQNLWDAYFFYPITESKLNDILNARLGRRSIRWKKQKTTECTTSASN